MTNFLIAIPIIIYEVEIMKKREIDYFGIVIGLVIGALFGYFLGLKINFEDEIPVIGDVQEGNVYLLQIMKGDNKNIITDTLKTSNFNYEIVEENSMYYVYVDIAIDKDNLEKRKEEFYNLGFNPVIKSDYILDWPDKYSKSPELKEFYKESIDNLFNSLENKPVVINEKYYNDPLDFEVFSNLTILQAIKNEKLKKQIELELYNQLLKKLN